VSVGVGEAEAEAVDVSEAKVIEVGEARAADVGRTRKRTLGRKKQTGETQSETRGTSGGAAGSQVIRQSGENTQAREEE